ncbi:polyamine ABC transporter substrate-binding protein [Sphingosinicella rhizophila]|uniref:Polyamine ABC transporter substrate-binding protein n=1 Tax=Sphingosinicella rhizophila TaxID=3050082 RepID=A0ABU3QBJ6_9SPHN|nr:polyamine ABC transporter substrate-binding protein [Sphingosinicella sp. GR2756]MDT9600325.1 polyamine ABC transporter substrate-binding protein [Sphingosinicella sp. GR2756]
MKAPLPWIGFTFLLAILAGAVACTGQSEPRPLTVVAWGGSSQDAHRNAYWTRFTRETGVQLREDTWHGGLGVIRTKVIGGDASWDIVQVETEDVILGCEEGLFEPLEWASLGGRTAFIPTAVHDCGVGAMLWSYLIGYDGDRIKGPGPASWADFWDVKRFPGKRGMRKTPKYTLEFALMADGVSPAMVYPTLRTPAGVDRAFRKLDELKPFIVWWSSISQVPDLLGSREVVMSVTSPGRLIVANRTEDRNFKVNWHNNIYAVDYWVILKNSPRKAEAEQLLRYMTRPENQARLPRFIPTGLTSKEAGTLIDPKLKLDTPSDPANMRNALELDGNFWVEYGDQLTQRFNAWVAR